MNIIEDKIKSIYIQRQVEFDAKILKITKLYEEFRAKFSPEALAKIDDKDLPRKMFYSEKNDRNSMCWFLEFKDESRKLLGSIGGGSSYKYGLHYNDKHNSWVTGSWKNPQILTEQEAIEKAKKTRYFLTKAVEIVERYSQSSNKASSIDYKKMSKEIEDFCGDIANKGWLKKYLHMIFPNLFSTFYSRKYLVRMSEKCELPIDNKNTFELSGQIAVLAERISLLTSIVGQILLELFSFKEEEMENDEEDESGEWQTESNKRAHSLNVILYGPPGTGKTYLTSEYAVAMIENRPVRENLTAQEFIDLKKEYEKLVKNGQIVFTTFHQSYSYEDFIQGLRPEPKGNNIVFRYRDGVFKKIADTARENPDLKYVIIIDEINRGNISKIFGELITLIEEDKRWGEKNQLSVILPTDDTNSYAYYTKKFRDFAVPNNLYVLGTMNSADKSISLIDTALRRRFNFIEIPPNANLVKDVVLKSVLERLNKKIKETKQSADLLIGHAYFMDKTENDLKDILNRNIIPLLYEYYYDNENSVNDVLREAIKGTNVTIDTDTQGRIRVK